ncbi:TRAP transporter substrate-binding protein [Denitromonas ohlonensis]|uniref:Twin-arginine translocation signal domain-containing protein n=2 Tax=Denitromonas TaxID=139331 RepID=A0A558EU92_9RHOO|nr:TRAP transporter substrate-binding protein [Denitromonas ohlonensis]TVO63042.1 twin-arginine translocation signal domain-containing protein [Denitromonas ohlonensis]TVO73706.1 twin-arginine translocation signal domain-containing protein [Denitromonas ohlonensis]TVT76965.1 MAG: twin-arginine translocation signal domain-containing protein [Denitromonas halophila]
MERRSFLKKTGVGIAAGAVAAPAIAQGLPEIQWRLASSFPKSLDTIYGAAEMFQSRVAAATGGKFQIRVFAGGEIVPAFSVMDAVKDGTVECGHTASYYFFGKDPAFALDTAVPFGLNAREFNAWFMHGGGKELLREFFAGYNIMNFPMGNTAAQMGGWFRKEIKSVKDLDGLKFRVGGFAGKVLSKLGTVPQQIPGGDIYPSLEKGTIDAAEWIGPYDDEKLGFQKVAQFYYYPGWWEGGPNLSLYINQDKWKALPEEYKNIIEAAAAEANVDMLAKYDAKNPDALKRLVAGGAKLRPFPRDVMDASYKAAQEVYAETTAASPAFKKIYEAMVKFRDDQNLWHSVADGNFDRFMQTRKR